MPFLIIFIIIPLIEIGLFMEVGDAVGLGNTLLLCLLTAMIGALLLRHQGLVTLISAQRSMSQNELPVAQLFDGICLAIAGITLITPGFFTDIVGFSLLVPQLRTYLRTRLAKAFNLPMNPNMGTDAGTQTQNQEQNGDVIDAEFTRLDDKDKRL